MNGLASTIGGGCHPKVKTICFGRFWRSIKCNSVRIQAGEIFPKDWKNLWLYWIAVRITACNTLDESSISCAPGWDTDKSRIYLVRAGKCIWDHPRKSVVCGNGHKFAILCGLVCSFTSLRSNGIGKAHLPQTDRDNQSQV